MKAINHRNMNMNMRMAMMMQTKDCCIMRYFMR